MSWVPSKGAIYLTWLSYGNDPYQRKRPDFRDFVVDEGGEHILGPLYSSLLLPASPLFEKVQQVYVCWRDAPPQGGRIPEREVWQQTRQVMSERLGEISLVGVPWVTEKPPTDHEAILAFTQETIDGLLQKHPDADIYVNISPGTPAMQAAWLLLGSSGYGDPQLHLLQGRPAHARRDDEPTLTPVTFELDTYLRRFQASQPARFETEDSGHLWDPRSVRSPAMRAAMKKIESWAPLRVPILLLGERGVGKTTLANYIRAIGPFQKQGANEWPVVVCGQFRVDPGLARAELFGHEKGAFSGAISRRKGLLERADGDCLFLDEIADLDHTTQRMLVAVLEGRGFSRLGGVDVLRSSFRLVCATNRTGEELHKVLDSDFFDRISYAVVRIPPLRQCTEDMPWLWEKVWRRAEEQAGLSRSFLIDNEAKDSLISALQNHPLPGNLRDLYRLAYGLLAALHSGEEPTPAIKAAFDALDEWPLPQIHSQGELLPTVEECMSYLPLESPCTELVGSFRCRMVEAALRYSRFHTGDAAKALGVERRTFHNWKDKYEGK